MCRIAPLADRYVNRWRLEHALEQTRQWDRTAFAREQRPLAPDLLDGTGGRLKVRAARIAQPPVSRMDPRDRDRVGTVESLVLSPCRIVCVDHTTHGECSRHDRSIDQSLNRCEANTNLLLNVCTQCIVHLTRVLVGNQSQAHSCTHARRNDRRLDRRAARDAVDRERRLSPSFDQQLRRRVRARQLDPERRLVPLTVKVLNVLVHLDLLGRQWPNAVIDSCNLDRAALG